MNIRITILIITLAIIWPGICTDVLAQNRIDLEEHPGMYSVVILDVAADTELFSENAEQITRHVRSVALSTTEFTELSEKSDILINPVFRDSQGNLAHVDHRINVYMAYEQTEDQLERWLASQGLHLGVEHKSWREGRAARYHTLTLQPPFKDISIVETANRLLENREVDIAYPNLIHQAVPHSLHGITDPLYEDQWNHGKIESELAWLITKGDSDVTIGVLDNGVDYDHPNLTDNILRDGQGNVIGGDFTSDNNPTAFPVGDESHGTQVAGLAAAPINSTGMVGAAPQASIVPLKIATGQSGTSRPWSVDQMGFVDALDYATLNDIDILVASWGIQFTNIGSVINQAFEDAIEDGRDGKGIVIVFSAGNAGNDHPDEHVAHRNDVITVGATTASDQKWDYSSYPSGFPYEAFVDIAAPSGNIGTTPTTLNWSTDISGSNGVSNDDHWHFGGTSAAAPLVAGAAALLLSMDSGLTHQQVKDLIYDNADKVGGYSYTGLDGKSAELGHGRLNAYKSVLSTVTQYSNHNFSSQKLSHHMYLTGSTTIGDGETLMIGKNTAVIVDGSFTSTGKSTVRVFGGLIVKDSRTLNNIELIIEEGGNLITNNNVTFDMDAGMFIVDGNAVIGSGFTMNDGIIYIGSSGSMEFEGSALLEFMEAGPGPIYVQPSLDIQGTFKSTNNITMQLSPNSIFGEWNGITVYNSSQGSQLWGLTIKDAKTGIYLSAVDSVHLWHIDIESPSEAGLVSMSSNPLAANIYVTNSGGMGVDISGGNPEIDYFDATGNSESGVRSANYATSNITEGSVSGSGAGASYAGVWVENASHTHKNGTIGSVAGWQAAAVNNAWAWFNGTSWAGGTPYIYYDSSSHLNVQNPNNPQKAPGGEHGLQAELLRQWGELYRERPQQAVSWAEDNSVSRSDGERAVLSVLLADHYLATGEFESAAQVLGNARDGTDATHLAPGAIAQREVLLAVHGPENESLGRQAIDALRQTEYDGRHLALLEDLVDRRYGEQPEAEQPEQLAEITEAMELELSSYPNPFNPVTVIRYQLPVSSDIRLEVFDMAGRRVASLVNGEMSAGSHEVVFDGSNLASGVYIYRLATGGTSLTNRFTLIK